MSDSQARRGSDGIAILSLLRDHGAMTRSELGHQLGVGRARLGSELDALGDSGLVQLDGPQVSRGGRPSRVIQLRPDIRFVGVQVGATSVEVAITDGNLDVIGTSQTPLQLSRPPESMVEAVGSLVDALRKELRVDEIDAVGVAVPSPVSFEDGIPVNPPLMPEWNGFPLRDRFAEYFGCAAVVDNDVNAMAMGELWGGVARGASDFLYVKLGTGIGSAIVLGEHVYRGMDGSAGDIGHIQVAAEPLCVCGKHGCLEAVFGGAALARDALKLAMSGASPVLKRIHDAGGRLDATSVGSAAAQGDSASMDLIREGGDQLAKVLAAVVNVLNPRMIVIGGGVAQLGDAFLAGVRQRIYQDALPLATRNLPIVRSTMGEMAGAMGAAYIASQRCFSAA